jgi:hypothetical protein
MTGSPRGFTNAQRRIIARGLRSMGPSRAPRRTDQQHVTPAVGNLFEAKPGPTFFGSAYAPVLQHLREGSHTIVSDAVLPDGPRTCAAP